MSSDGPHKQKDNYIPFLKTVTKTKNEKRGKYVYNDRKERRNMKKKEVLQ